jgi:DNA-binding IclR family transcriptional regulator
MDGTSLPETSPVGKAVRILSLIAHAEAPLALAQLSAALRFPKPTVYRIAALLEQEGFLHKDPVTRRYSVGAALHDLSFHAIRAASVHNDRQILLQRLSEKLSETVNLAVLVGREVVYLERVECSWPLRMDLRPGSRVPLHCTANGKLLLAFAPRRRRELLLDSISLRPYTPKTITDKSALRRELLEIRRRGYSEDNEEFLAGACCLAVPVKDRRGITVAGLAVSAPSARFPLERARSYLGDVQACATELGLYVEAVQSVGSQRRSRT